MRHVKQTDKDGLGVVRVYPDKTPIYHQGDKARRIFRVNSGVVMTFRLLEDSRRQITGFCTEGEFFGLSPYGDYTDSAITVSSSGIQSVSISALQTEAHIRDQILHHSFRKIEDSQNLMVALTKTTSEARVAAFLIMLAERGDRGLNKAEGSIDVHLPMSRLDIADYLGLSRETVSRRLNDLQNEGLIDLPDTHTAKIKRFATLCECAGIRSAKL